MIILKYINQIGVNWWYCGLRSTIIIFGQFKKMPTSKELEFIQKIHGKLLDYLIQNKDKKIHSMISIDDFLSEFNFSITESSDLKELEFFIDGYLDSSVNTSSPHFYNQLFSGFSTMGYLGEAITGLTNN